MKKLLFLLPIAVLLAAGCSAQQAYNQTPTAQNPTSSPEAAVSTSTPATPITEQQAIDIATKDLGSSSSNYDVSSYLQNNNWYVNFSPKQPPCNSPSPCSRITGGGISYVINSQTGAIVSKQLGQ